MKRIPKSVIEEAANLKKFATKEEIDNLDFSVLDSRNQTLCVYGQMTGNCHSQRSVDLIRKCALRVYPSDANPGSSKKLNGSPVGLSRNHWKVDFWSPIEVWIDRDIPQFNKNLIAYLKGEKKTLKSTYK